jgi:hypothetical protein
MKITSFSRQSRMMTLKLEGEILDRWVSAVHRRTVTTEGFMNQLAPSQLTGPGQATGQQLVNCGFLANNHFMETLPNRLHTLCKADDALLGDMNRG